MRPSARGPGKDGGLRPSLLLGGSLALGGGLSYFYHIALGRLLGPELYGAFAALLGLFYLLWVFSQSVQLRLARLGALTPHIPQETLKSIAGGGLGIALGIAALSGPLAGWLRLETPLWVVFLALVWLLGLPLPAAKGLLQGRQRFGELALLNVLEPLVKLPLGVLLVLGGAGLYGAWGAWGLAALLVLPLAVLALRRGAEGSSPTPTGLPSVDVPDASEGGLLLPLLAAGVLAVPTNVDVLVAKHAFPAATAGLYAAAAVLGKGFLFVALSVGAVLLPKAAASESEAERRRHLSSALSLGLGIGALGALLCALLPQLLLSLLLGSAYREAAPLLRLYGTAMFAFTGVVLLLNYGLARGQRSLVVSLAILSALEALLLLLLSWSGGWGPRTTPEPKGLATAFLGAQLVLLGTALGLTHLQERRRGEGEPPEPGRVALVAPYPPPGSVHAPEASGVASYTRNLVEALCAREGAPEVVLLAPKLSHPPEKGGRTAEEDSRSHPKVSRCWTPSWLFPWQIARAVCALRPRPRVVHLQHEIFLFGEGPKALLFPLLVLLLRLWGKAKTIVTLHGVPPLRRLDREFVRENGLRGRPGLLRLGLKVLLRAIVKGAHRVVVHEELFRRRLEREYGCSPAKVAVIPHGIEPLSDAERSRLPTPEAAKRALGLEGRCTILYLGYLTGYKGVEVLLEGFAQAAPAHPDWVLLLAGGPHPRRRSNPEYRAYLRRIEAQTARIGPQVRALGFVPEERLGEVFQAADVVVFPYRSVMASSGPLALCVKFDRPFLASCEFGGVLPRELLFPLDPEAVRTTLERFFTEEGLARCAREVAERWRRERSWAGVAERTRRLYRSLGGAGDRKEGRS